MSEFTKETWEVVDISDLSLGDEVIVMHAAIKGKVAYLDHAAGNAEVKIPGVENVLDLWHDQGYEIERMKKRDLRKIRDIVANPSSVSNRTLLVQDPYGKIHSFVFQGSVGIRVYPSGTVTFSTPEDASGIYVSDGIDGIVEVV